MFISLQGLDDVIKVNDEYVDLIQMSISTVYTGAYSYIFSFWHFTLTSPLDSSTVLVFIKLIKIAVALRLRYGSCELIF